jgi:hypothetical protein
MKEEPLTDALMRQFLLGKVDEEVRQRIESLFMTDAETKERILAVEQELIDDYLDNRLSSEDRELFLQLHGATPAQQRRLRIAKSINDWIDTSNDWVDPSTEQSRPAPTVSIWRRLRERFTLRPIVVIPAVATAILAIVLAILWLNARLDQQDQQRAPVNQTIARPSDRSPQDQVASLTLSPVAPRSGDSSNELLKRSDVQIVELRLVWIQDVRYPAYRAVIRRVSDENPLPSIDLTPEADGTLLIKLPARVLTGGDYRIELTGIGPDGTTTGFAEHYNFTVRE